MTVPAKTKNYYTHIHEHKDICKIMSQMTNSFQSTKNVSTVLSLYQSAILYFYCKNVLCRILITVCYYQQLLVSADI